MNFLLIMSVTKHGYGVALPVAPLLQGHPAINNFWIGEARQVCTELSSGINEWGKGTWNDGTKGTEFGKEIVLTYRAIDLNVGKQYDIIPDDGSPEKEEMLNGLHHMAFRFSDCIDYVQLGNEHWSGSGVLLVNGQQINNLSAEQLEAAISNDIKPWYREQAKVVRTASALAGRPLRLITSGLIGKIVYEAAAGGNENAKTWIHFLVDDFANTNELIVDIHLHYEAVGDVDIWLSALTSPANQGWSPPNHIGVLEWSPVVNTQSTWYTSGGGRTRHEKYYIAGSGLTQSWNEFVREWEGEQYFPDGFQLSSVLTSIELSGSLMACYGATVQGGEFLDIYWDLAALKANMIADEYLDDTVHKFTTLVDGAEGSNYEAAALAGHLVGDPPTDFKPHEYGCDCIDVCEECSLPPGE